MKQFCFLNEDDLGNLPKDIKLIPFNVAYLQATTDQEIAQSNNKQKYDKKQKAFKPCLK